MSKDVDLYDGYYAHIAADPLVAVRRETYEEDIGQSSWITASQAREFVRALELGPGRTALEVACGSGGVTCLIAVETGAACVGIGHQSARGRSGAKSSARSRAVGSRIIQVVDAGQRLPFCRRVVRRGVLQRFDETRTRAGSKMLRKSHRVLRSGGRLLFTIRPS